MNIHQTRLDRTTKRYQLSSRADALPMLMSNLLHPTDSTTPPAAKKKFKITLQIKGRQGVPVSRSILAEECCTMPDTNTPEFAASVQEATKGRVFITEFLKLSQSEQHALLTREELYIRGHFKMNDAKQKQQTGMDGIISLMASDVQIPGTAPASNMTLSHESFHAIVNLAKDTGAIDNELLAFLRQVFGDPLLETEGFNEEAAANEYTEWTLLQTTTRLPAYPPPIEYLTKHIKETPYRMGWKSAPGAFKTPRQAKEAVFQAVRSADFRNLYNMITRPNT